MYINQHTCINIIYISGADMMFHSVETKFSVKIFFLKPGLYLILSPEKWLALILK